MKDCDPKFFEPPESLGRDTEIFPNKEISRQELRDTDPGKMSFDECAPLLQCFKRLAALPGIEGLALSRRKNRGGLYFHLIVRDIDADDHESERTVDESLEVMDEFGDALNQVLPGSFIVMGQDEPFEETEQHFKAQDLDLISVVRFIGP